MLAYFLPTYMCIPVQGGSSAGANKTTKKVCFAARTSSGSHSAGGVAGEGSTSKEGDETDGDETNDEEEEGSTQPFKEKEKEKEEEGKREDVVKEKESRATVKRTDTGAGSMMDVDESDPTVAYDLETDEDNTDVEEGGGESERKKEGATAAEPTVPYDLKEEVDKDDDSDRTKVDEKEVGEKKREDNEAVSKASKEAKASGDKEAKASGDKEEGSSSKTKGKAGGVAGDHSEETEDGGETEEKGDTEKLESSATEPESQEVKEKRKSTAKKTEGIEYLTNVRWLLFPYNTCTYMYIYL